VGVRQTAKTGIDSAPISVLAEALGLELDASNEEIQQALKPLIEQQRYLHRREGLWELLTLIKKAITPPGGYSGAPQVWAVEFDRRPKTVEDVVKAVRRARDIISKEPPATIPFPGGAITLPPAPTRTTVAQSSHRNLNVEAFRNALEYLQDNGVVQRVTGSGSSIRLSGPAPDMNRVLARNKMQWKCPKTKIFWEPCPISSEKTSIFDMDVPALREYKQKATRIAGRAFFDGAIEARHMSSYPMFYYKKNAAEKRLCTALINLTKERTGSLVPDGPQGAATITRLLALYHFLKTEQDNLPTLPVDPWR
jgi:hypothetical protein